MQGNKTQHNNPVRQIAARIVYGTNYCVYLLKLVLWKLKEFMKKRFPKFYSYILSTNSSILKPIYYILNPKSFIYGSVAIVCIVTIILGYPRIIQFLTAPRPLPLTTAPKNSGFEYVATDKVRNFSAYIGSSGTNAPKVQATFANGNTIDFVLTDINQNISKPSKSGNKVVFKDVRTNVDLAYQTLTNGIKEDIIVKKPTEGLPAQAGNAFTFTLNNFGAVPKKIAPDTYGPIFYDSKGAYVFHFAKPFAVDAKGARTDNVVLAIHKTDKDSGYKATIIVNQKWLDDPARVYPISIDPTIVYNTTSLFSAGQFNRVTDTGPTTPNDATGGTITHSGGYTIHTFTSSGTFTPTATMNVEVLVVAGGGGGGRGRGGGGGAGGLIYNASFSLSAQAYSVTVGGGGGGSTSETTCGTSGSNSVFSSLTAVGGGGGESVNTSSGGCAGGSGGGANLWGGPGGTATSGQGNNGGMQSGTYLNNSGAGGGGGAGAVGGNGGSNIAGSGGTGSAYSISGSSVTYAGGGGGSTDFYSSVSGTAGSGGAGGGGAGGTGTSGNNYLAVGGDATANTGGGGGGGTRNAGSGTTANGGAGGSGIVIIRYPTTYLPNLTTYYQELPTDSATVGLWRMNEASGTTTVSDSSGNGNAGTSASSTNVDTGILNNARTFNGTSDKISIPSSSNYNFSGDFSIEFWFKTGSSSTMYPLYFGGNGSTNIAFDFNDSGYGIWLYWNGNGTPNLRTTKTYYDNNWHHVAATRTGSTITLYVDGVSIGTATDGSAINGGTNGNRYIGSFQTGSANYWNGSLDELRISNVARTPEEIRMDAQRRPYSVYTSDVISASATGWNSLSWTELGVGTGDGETLSNSTNLVAQWNFNNTSSTTTATNDAGSCGSSCNGTLTNMVSTGQDASLTSGWTANNKRWGAGALMFDGSNDYVSCADGTCGGTANLDIGTRSFSIAAWIKTTSSASQNIAAKGAASQYSYQFLTTNGSVYFQLINTTFGAAYSGINSNRLVNDGNWHYVVGTWDASGTTSSIYVDGKLDATTSSTNGTFYNDSTAEFDIGRRADNTGYFNGVIDTVSVFGRALTANEILSNYNAGNVELQTRVGNTTDPNDGSWEAWSPTTSESQIDSMDSNLTGASGCSATGGTAIDGGNAFMFTTGKTVYSYSGANQTYTVPAGVTSIQVKEWGGGGGGGAPGGWSYGFAGGGGGYTTGTIAVTPGQPLTVMVGAGGTTGTIANTSPNYGGGARTCNTGSDCRFGGQGGGRSAIRYSDVDLLTAGGGGGGGSSRVTNGEQGGAGGGSSGVVGSSYTASYGGGPGTQSAGGTSVNGTAGTQYAGGNPGSNAYGGSGGGGWYGGGGGSYGEPNDMGGGGGGSGYIGGSGVSSATTTAGSGSTQANSADSDNGGTGAGGAASANGIPGKVVITPVQSAQSITCTTGGNVEVLVAAGGGGGGANMGGGGGGGGVIYNPSYSITANTPASISVGAGGMGAPAGYSGIHAVIAGANGENSVFGTLTAIGGGRGGTAYNSLGSGINTGAAGGSGGGATGYNDNNVALGTVTGGAGTAGQGYRGGNQGNQYYSGGGGGGGGPGADGNNQANGGVGYYSDIYGPGYFWGGGGGGAGYTLANGGNGGSGGGGGGAGGVSSGGSGLNPGAPGGGGCTSCWTDAPGGNGGISTGGGGGAGGHYNYNNKGGSGGSGIVIVRISRTTTDTTTKLEGTGSQKITSGSLQDDANTVGLWHLDETSGTGAYLKNSSTNTKSVFTCTGANQTYTVPDGVTSVHVKMWGAGGGAGNKGGWTYGFSGGGGGYSEGDITVTPGQQLTVITGCGGHNGSVSGTAQSYGGGGRSCGGTDCAYGGQGGGASAIYIGSDYVLAAGGGGGGGASRATNGEQGAAGGGTTGQDGTSYTAECRGRGGTQSAGGAAESCSGPGGAGTKYYGGNPYSTYSYGGAGGGGWYGGSAGAYQESNDMGGGGGGSGYTGGAGVSNAQTLTGNWRAQAAASDSDNAGAGMGGGGDTSMGTNNGADGRVVITPVGGHINDGTPTGTTVVNGIRGKARSFNGSSDLISVANNSTLDFGKESFTMEWWEYRTDSTNAKASMDRANTNDGVGYTPWIAGYENAGSLYFYATSCGSVCAWDIANAQSMGSISLNQWTHLAVTRNGTTFTTYNNGIQQATWTSSGAIQAGAGSLEIGRYWSGGYFKGALDEIRFVRGVARSAGDIAEDYRLGRDQYINRTISANLSAAQKLEFDVAADRPGTYLEATVGNNSYANYEPDANTVGLWHLDEQSGSGAYFKDSSGNGNNASVGGGSPTYAQGKIGKGRSFASAGGDNISIPNSSSLGITGSGSLDAWVYPTTVNSPDMIISKPNGGNWQNHNYALGISSGQVFCVIGNGTTGNIILSTYSLTANNWYHLAFTWNGSTLALYINGILNNTASQTITPAANTASINIGRWTGFTSYDFDGIIDEVRISNTARSAADIRAAYEYGKRSHEVTVDFAAQLDSGNLISNSSDLSFTVDATKYGLSNKGSNLYLGDKIIVRENYNGTTYIAQGTVNGVTTSTGAVTVAAWDSGSTFPASGFTVNADVFKWQQEYFDLGGSLSTQRNAITNLTLRNTNGQEGRTVWLDDVRSAGTYLTTPAGSSITSNTGDQYAQYRIIFSTSDYNVSSSVTSATLDFNTLAPLTPTIGAASNITATSIQWNFTDNASNELGFKEFDSNNNLIATINTPNLSSYTETGLTPNTSYTRKFVAYNANGGSTFSGTATAVTLAAIPATPTTSSPTSTTLSLTPTAGTNNPSSTQYAIYQQTGSSCTGSGGNYLAADGTSSGSTALWQTISTWGTLSITGLNLDTTQTIFCVKARNSNTIETAFTGNSTGGGYLPVAGDFTMIGNMTFAAASRLNDGNLGGTACSSGGYCVAGLDRGAAGLWKFDEASGNAVDSSGNNFTGTPTGTTLVTGKYSSARRFNGSSDIITVPENNALDPSTITIDAWIKPNVMQNGTIVDKGDDSGYRLRMNADGTLTFYDRGNTNTVTSHTQTALISGNWYHVAAIGASNGLKIYINGVLDQSNSTPYGGPNTSSDLIMGRYSTNAEYFSGDVDDVHIYQTALTTYQIKQDMNNAAPQNVSNFILSSGTLTVNANTTVAAGSFTFPNGSQASIALRSDKTAVLKPGAALWYSVADADNDGYTAGDLTKLYYGASPNPGKRRFLGAPTGTDCDDTDSVIHTVKVTGGTITRRSGGYTIHTFTGSDTLTVSCAPSSSLSVDYLIVAGGGGGGSRVAGGGGAGGMREGSASVTSGQSYAVTVGGGGAPGVNPNNSAGAHGSNGGSSSIAGVNSTTGGGGGGNQGAGSNPYGSSGGSGGGSCYNVVGGSGISGEGNNGGTSEGGGGGGKSQSGGANNGGNGQSAVINGVTYAGGGGGWAGVGGSGGGGSGGDTGTNGGTNTGGGGGGENDGATGKHGGTGGSGIVVIRYLDP